jgi:hypothetical protein
VRVLVLEARILDPVVLCAALLHDTVEDTGTTPNEIEARFGLAVRDVVLEVTDDKRLPKAERKRRQVIHAAGASQPARLVKLADKICNLRDVAASPPVGWDSADWSFLALVLFPPTPFFLFDGRGDCPLVGLLLGARNQESLSRSLTTSPDDDQGRRLGRSCSTTSRMVPRVPE